MSLVISSRGRDKINTKEGVKELRIQEGLFMWITALRGCCNNAGIKIMMA